MGQIEDRLAAHGLTLPPAPAPAANYVAHVLVGDMLHVSGQIAADASGPIVGRLGETMDVAAGQAAARACALALLAQARAACDGDLERILRLVKMTGYVNSTPDFTDHPKVINGASDLMADLLGPAGEHARAAVGVAALPFGVAVEIDGLFRVAPPA
jgi:enamine deaminase RidA (YjgF/YER057c/UK114 family)